MNYSDFVSGKLTRVPPTGMPVIPELNPKLFPHQRDLVTWALRRGRCAIFADTGLGKSFQELEWARCVAEYTGGKVLMLAPLAVAAQTVREAGRFGIDAKQIRFPGDLTDSPQIVVTNYDRVEQFDCSQFAGVVCDESSVIKNNDSKTFARLTELFGQTPFRLCATATPSPNDYTELGTHAEFLGVCSREEMLAEYFTHDGGDTSKWRLKGHAKKAFWTFVASWAALIRRPSDFGYEDAGYALPKLHMIQHTIAADHSTANEDVTATQTSLFAERARTLTERRKARKGSLLPRVAACAEVVLAEPNEPWVVWCELNAEADALVKAIPGALEIRGSDEIALKEKRLEAFANGEIRVLISKPKIAGFGLNWQHAARMAFVGVKDSYESTYQAIRRCWRFGQTREVHVHVFSSELEGEVVKNLERKEAEAFAMGEALSLETRDAIRSEIHGQKRVTNTYDATKAMSLPGWIK